MRIKGFLGFRGLGFGGFRFRIEGLGSVVSPVYL